MGAAFTTALIFQFKTRAEMQSMRGGAHVSVRDALRTLAAKSAIAIVFSFVQAIALVSVLLCLGRYHADAGGGDGLTWAHSPGLMIAYAAYMSFSFLSINAMALQAIGVEKFTTVTTLLLILQLTSSGGFFAETLSNRFFLIGRGLPFYYGTRAFRTIMFGGQENWMPINWMVPTVWNVGSFAIFCAFAVARLQRKVLKGKQPFMALTPLTGLVMA